MDYFHFYIHKPKSIYVTTDIQVDAEMFSASYEIVDCLGHKEELQDFNCRLDEIVKKRKCLKMFWGLVDVLFMITLLGACGFFGWLLQGPWRGIVDGEVIGFFVMLLACTALFFVMRFTQTIELTLADGSVRLIPIGAFLLGPFEQIRKNEISRFDEKIYRNL